MRARDKIRHYDLPAEELNARINEILDVVGDIDSRYQSGSADFTPNKVLKGKIVDIRNDEVVVDIGYKSEGVISANEFQDITEYDVGDEIEVLLESADEAGGGVLLSKRKADRIRGWERVVKEYGEGATVRGRVIKKIKGGLLVDIGVPVFLPASQVSIRRTNDISEFIGRDIEARIIKIDEERMNIVVSRRRLIEEQREEAKKTLLQEIKPGQIRTGVVKNIADFGAFVDLGGIDGLLHITDMSWSRLTHPSDMLKIDDEIEVMVLRVDLDRERIALGLKQKFPSPWETVELKYPVGSRVKGNVVNVMPYGAFVKLEDGIEGLVHISEMSWSKRISHPEEVVSVGDEVEVVVLDINRDKQEISLGMKQADGDPWDDVEARFPPGTVVEGTVRNLTSYGAFVEIDEGLDGLLHVSDMSWTKKIANPSEVLDKGEKVKAVVLSVHPDKKRIALGLKQLELDPWQREIMERYAADSQHVGTVTKVTNFGIFVELEEGLEGLLHISELTPTDNLQAGTPVAVRVLRLETEERKIGLGLLRGEEAQEVIDELGLPTPPASLSEAEEGETGESEGGESDAAEAPAEAMDAPAETTDAPAETTDAPAETTDAPAEPAEAQAEPAEAAADTTDAPAEPAEAAADTTDAPAEPPEAAADTTDAPAEPAEAQAETAPETVPETPAEVEAPEAEAGSAPVESEASPEGTGDAPEAGEGASELEKVGEAEKKAEDA